MDCFWLQIALDGHFKIFSVTIIGYDKDALPITKTKTNFLKQTILVYLILKLSWVSWVLNVWIDGRETDRAAKVQQTFSGSVSWAMQQMHPCHYAATLLLTSTWGVRRRGREVLAPGPDWNCIVHFFVGAFLYIMSTYSSLSILASIVFWEVEVGSIVEWKCPNFSPSKNKDQYAERSLREGCSSYFKIKLQKLLLNDRRKTHLEWKKQIQNIMQNQSV